MTLPIADATILLLTTTSALIAIGAAGVEGACLAGAKALQKNTDTVSKIAKYALVFIAMVFALLATAATGIAAYCLTCFFLPELVAITVIVGIIAAAATIPAHVKAIKWSGILN